jgi:hypothetical protein
MAKKSRNVRYSRVNLKQPNVVLREVDYIVARAAQFDSRVVTLGQLITSRPPQVTRGCSTLRTAWR